MPVLEETRFEFTLRNLLTGRVLPHSTPVKETAVKWRDELSENPDDWAVVRRVDEWEAV